MGHVASTQRRPEIVTVVEGLLSLTLVLNPGLAFGLHYILFKAFTVDERWVEQRVEDLTIKSYDRGHIEDIRGRQQQNGRPRS